MTRDEVIAMAREAGFKHNAFSQACVKHSSGAWVDVAEELATFADLVAAKEREACAKLIDDMTERRRWIRGGINGESTKPCEYAAAIRARSTP